MVGQSTTSIRRSSHCYGATLPSQYKRQPIMTAHKIEQKTHIRRAQESKVGDLLRYASESQKLCNAAANEVKMNHARKSNFVAQIAAEKLEKEQMEKDLEDARKNALLQEQNQRFAEKISQRNTQREKMQLEIQRICETSEELKELERNLKIAYVNKERAAQHQEAILLKKLEQARERAIDDKMEHDRKIGIKVDAAKDAVRRKQLSAQKEVLQKQMQEKKELELRMKEEALRDKEMVDAIMSKIQEEDELEIRERNRMKEETRHLVQQFEQEREYTKQMLTKQEKEQEAEIEAYSKKIQERKEAAEQQKKEEEAQKRKLWLKVTEETKAQTESRELFGRLRDMLWEEELEEKRSREEKERAEMRARRRREMMRDNQAQIKNKQELIAKMEEEERHLVEVMLAKFAADEMDEKRRQEERRLAKDQFVREAQQQRIDRAKLFELEKEKEIEERKAGAIHEEYRQRIIAEARRKLLAQHAAQLNGFLPK